tara:strand:- start:2428 stop:3273 length:846 start_codon:yes stop_codon:yes gene_type:complete
MSTLAETAYGAHKLTQDFLISDGVAETPSRFGLGKQTINMADAAVTLIMGGNTGSGESRLVGNILYVDAQSTGIGESLKLPPEADWRGPLYIYNVGGETVFLQDDAAASLMNILPGSSAVALCDGTTIKLQAVGAAEEVIQQSVGQLSAAQVLALNATPITLVNAPGSGKYIEVVSVHLWVDYNSAAYAADAGEDFAIKYDDASGSIICSVETDGGTGLLEQTNDVHRILYPISTALYAIAPEGNQPVVAHILSGEVVSGDSPIKYRISYRIRTLEFSTSL